MPSVWLNWMPPALIAVQTTMPVLLDWVLMTGSLWGD
jgi:cellobiose-specific phosphotransferase system component IIC